MAGFADSLREFAQSASNSIAGNVSAPVDGIAWALRKAGVPVPVVPMGGTDWMAEKGLTKTVPPGLAQTLGEAAGMSGPMVAMAKAPKIAGGLLGMTDNALAPQTLNRQAGMLRIPGRGQIPESRADVNKLADRFARLLDDAKVPYQADKSGLSPARYFEFNNPSAPAADVAEYGQQAYKVRISDHKNIHGADYSVDPQTGQTFEEMLKNVQGLGVPIANRAKPASKAVIDDATLERIWGLSANELGKRGMLENLRSRYKLSPQGYWVDK